MDKLEVVEIINKKTDSFFSDLNNSIIKRNRVRNLYSAKEFFINTIRPPVYKNWKRNKIYFSENLKDWKSDDKINPFMQAAAKVFLFDVNINDLYEAEIEYCKNNEIPYSRRLLNNIRNLNKETILITRHVFPDPYVKYFGFTDKVSNYTDFDDKGNFKGFRIPIRTGKDKLKATRIKARERNIKNWAVMVDGINDIPLIEAKETVLSLASPLAKEEVKKKVDYPIKSFEDLGVLASMIGDEMPRTEPLRV